jgi:hypothetical protein
MGLFRGRRERERADPDVYQRLRQQILGLRAEQLGEAFAEAPILALLMETGYPTAVVTLVGVVDGTSSLYFSTGGGVIGAGTHETVAQANAAWLAMGGTVLPQMSASSAVPLPGEGKTQFVAVTPRGLFATSAREEDLGTGAHALSPFFYAAQDVITQIRLTQGG